MIFLIDGDILLYKACASAEREVEWEEDIFSLWTNLSDAKDNFVTALAGLMIRAKEQVEFDTHLICLSDYTARNWRKDVYGDYKATRTGRKPLGYKALYEWCASSYPIAVKPRLEADDCIGILATKPGNEALIWSIDKDLKQIPGKHLTDDGVVFRGIDACDEFHLIQTLTGDATDNYPGCKGVGPVKAEKIVGGGWPAVVEAYAKAGFTEEFALAQARIAKICRWEDWDQAKQEVKLWTP
jgi:DNA polymerase-1